MAISHGLDVRSIHLRSSATVAHIETRERAPIRVSVLYLTRKSGIAKRPSDDLLDYGTMELCRRIIKFESWFFRGRLYQVLGKAEADNGVKFVLRHKANGISEIAGKPGLPLTSKPTFQQNAASAERNRLVESDIVRHARIIVTIRRSIGIDSGNLGGRNICGSAAISARFVVHKKIPNHLLDTREIVLGKVIS